MRTTSALQDKVLSLPFRAHHLRVSIDRGSSDWVDVTTLESRDWLVSATWGEAADNNTSTATIVVRKKSFYLNLSPLVTNKLSTSGFIVDLGHPIKIETATVAQDSTPASGDWVEVFRGEIDSVNFPGETIEINARDQGGYLLDTFIETQNKRPASASFDSIEDIIQEILTAHASGVTLYSPNGTGGTPWNASDSPGWNITEYVQSKTSVMDALQTLAQMIGYKCQYKWHENTSAFQLQLYAPTRDVAAMSKITVGGQPANTETIVVNATTFTAVTSGATGNQFNIGTTLNETAQNIVTVLNEGGEADNLTATVIKDPDEVDDPLVYITWGTVGTAGNSVTFTEAVADAGFTMDGSGTLGGTRAGAANVSAADYTFADTDYFEFTQLALSREDVRNVWRIVFRDVSTGERSEYITQDTASIAKHGRRYAEATEDASSQVDSITEAALLGDSALSDTKDPDAILGVSMPYFWPAEVGDYYTFSANGDSFDTDQTLAVVAAQHAFGPDGARTQLTLRGKPSGGTMRWLELEGRAGIAPALDLREDSAPTSITVTPTLQGLVVEYTDPREMSPPITDWATTELHVSTSSGFTPTSSTLAASGRTTRLEAHGLTPGTTYYIKLRIIDEQGNSSVISSQSSTAAQEVGPYHENLNGQQDQLLRNNDLNIYTFDSATNPPDAWVVSGGTWGTDADRTTDADTGEGAVTVDVTSAGGDVSLYQRYIPVSDTDIFQLSAIVKSTSLSGQVRLFAAFYDSSKSYLGGTSRTFTPGTSFVQIQTAAISPTSGARYVGFYFTADDNVTHTATFDRVALLRAYANGHVVNTTAQTIGTSFADLQWQSGDIQSDDIGITHQTASNYTEMVIETPGIYIVNAEAQVDDTTATFKAYFQIRHYDASAASWTAVSSVTDAAYNVSGSVYSYYKNIGAPALFLDVGDKIATRAGNAGGGSTGTTATLRFLSVRQIVRIDQ